MIVRSEEDGSAEIRTPFPPPTPPNPTA